MARIFVSHSSKDAALAMDMLAWLRDQGFDRTFLDIDKHGGLPPGSDWERTLYREIARSEAVILLLTNNWIQSKWCFAEFTQARALGKSIFPMVFEPLSEPGVSDDIQRLDLTKDREQGLEVLARRLQHIAQNAHGEFPWDNLRPPFPGLLAFDEADAAIYFGRDDEVRRLIERLNARRAHGGAHIVALLGASGAGKSSLLRAGVLPRLKRDKRNWIVLPPFRPQTNPVEELILALTVSLGGDADVARLREPLSIEDLGSHLGALARKLRAAHRANEAHILISIDQGEELFSNSEPREAEQLFKIISAACSEPLPYFALLSFRSDYLGQLQQAAGLTAAFEEFSLKPMPLERVREIVERPAKLVGLAVDEALTAAIMRDATTDDVLPLLAFALRELYDRYGSRGRLTLAEYQALGDAKEGLNPLENAVRRRAEAVLNEAQPTKEDLKALKDAFAPAMVKVNPDSDYARQPARFDQLPAAAKPLLERLAKARLLVIRQDNEGRVVEVAHEALLRKWPLLRGWLDEEREFLIGKEQLRQDISDWQHASESDKANALLTGLKLTRARSWLESHGQQLSAIEREFIKKSIDHAAEEVRRRTRLRQRIRAAGIAASIVCVILAAAAGGFAIVANKRAGEAEQSFQTALDTAVNSTREVAESFRQGAITAKVAINILDVSRRTFARLPPGLMDDRTYRTQSQLFNQISRNYLKLGQVAKALEVAREQNELARSKEAAQRGNREWNLEAATSLGNLGAAYQANGAFQEALEAHEQRRRLSQQFVERNPNDADWLYSLREAYEGLGDVLWYIGRHDEALANFRKSLDTGLALYNLRPTKLHMRQLALSHIRIGDFQLAQQNYVSALAEFNNYVRYMEQLVAELQNSWNPSSDSDALDWRRGLSLGYQRLGDLMLAQGKIDDAREHYKKFFEQAKELARDQSNTDLMRVFAIAHQRIGDLEGAAHDLSAAESSYEQYQKISAWLVKYDSDFYDWQYDLSNSHMKLGDIRMARANADLPRKKELIALAIKEYAAFKRIASVLVDTNGSNAIWQRNRALSLQRMGDALLERGEAAAALDEYRQCAEIPSKVGLFDPRSGWPRNVQDYCKQRLNELATAAQKPAGANGRNP